MANAEARVASWSRALGVGLASVLLLVVAFFYVPQFILAHASWPARNLRVWLVTAWMGLAFAMACRVAWRMTRPAPR